MSAVPLIPTSPSFRRPTRLLSPLGHSVFPPSPTSYPPHYNRSPCSLMSRQAPLPAPLPDLTHSPLLPIAATRRVVTSAAPQQPARRRRLRADFFAQRDIPRSRFVSPLPFLVLSYSFAHKHARARAPTHTPYLQLSFRAPHCLHPLPPFPHSCPALPRDIFAGFPSRASTRLGSEAGAYAAIASIRVGDRTNSSHRPFHCRPGAQLSDSDVELGPTRR